MRLLINPGVLRESMAQRGVTAVDVGARACVSARYIRHLAAGTRTGVSEGAARQIARVLSVPLDLIVTRRR